MEDSFIDKVAARYNICYRGYPYSLVLHIYIASLLHSYSSNSVSHLLSPTIRDNIAQTSRAFPGVPLVDGNIDPSTEEPDEQRTKLYQELVGSLAYISMYTQLDVAQTHSELSQYLQNLG
jgi:hypothetical protein